MPESTFLRAIVSQAWQIAVLTVIVILLVRLFAAKRPQMACWLWLIVIVKCVTPPIWGHSLGLFCQIQSVVPYRDAQTIEAVAIAVEENMTAEFIPDSFAADVDVYPVQPADLAFNFEPELLANDFETITYSDGAGMQDVWTFITLLLIAGMIVSMLWLSWKFACCLRRIYAHRVTEFDEEIECVVATLVKELRLRRVPRVIVSDVRFGPAVLGVFRHLIVLPKCLIADESCRDPKTLRPILAHELLHIRRGDLWTGTLQAVVQCLWWFHPAVWIVNRLLSRETERSCDEQVVTELGYAPMDYARSLLAVIECKHRLKPVPVFPGMKPVEITSQRMERIMSLTQGSRTRKSWWSAPGLLLFAAVMLPGAVIGQQSEETGSPEEARLIDKEIQKTSADATMIFSGDQLKISITSGAPAGDKIEIPIVIGEDGKAELPAIGKVFLQGISPTSAAARIKSVLIAQGVFRDPQISVTIEHSNVHRIAVVGAVSLPGFYEKPQRLGDFCVVDAIALAGGLTELAGDEVVLSNQEGHASFSLQEVTQNAGLGVILRDGDTLCVKPAERSKDIPYLQRLVSVSFVDTPLPDVIRHIAVSTNSNIVIDRRSLSTDSDPDDFLVSMELNQVSLRTALEMLCKNYGLAFELENNVVKISGKKKPGKPSVPYNAKVVAERAFVRSGSGEPFYSTSALGRGSVVRVERQDPNGYCMVRPTRNCFSWVSTQYVRETESGKGVVVNSQAVVFVGSSLKATANVWQVRLKAGDAVKILGNQQVHTINGPMSAYRIEPPDGEYRWIRASALVPTDEGACVVDPEERFELQVYRVADLVVPTRENVGTVRVGSALMMASREKPQPLRADDNSMDELILNGNAADFTGLIELIRTTIEPDSWTDEGGRIVPNVKTLSLVIRQKPEVHDKVADLVQQLRSLQDRTVSSEFRILQFDTPEQLDWLNSNLQFHKTPKGYPWLLLPRSKVTRILTDAQKNSTEVSFPRFTTLAGQTASLQVAGSGETLLLELKAIPLSGNKLIELEYGVSVAQSESDRLPKVRRIVGNEQTLILDVTDMISQEDGAGVRVVVVITSSIVSELDYP